LPLRSQLTRSWDVFFVGRLFLSIRLLDLLPPLPPRES
jgi:hypothetical protein